MRAWARLFEPYLAEHGATPYLPSDYFDHIDGKPRYEGVTSLLVSRGIDLPFGDPSDPPSADTVCGLGNRKNSVFTALLSAEGVAPYPGSIAFLDALAERGGVAVAVVSSSKNARAVLAASGLLHRFAVVVDGLVAAERGIVGKPAPDTYLYGAELLGVPAARAVVVEDALSGVAAGRAGGFGHVLGVNRGAGRDELLAAGADTVVDDLGELTRMLGRTAEGER